MFNLLKKFKVVKEIKNMNPKLAEQTLRYNITKNLYLDYSFTVPPTVEGANLDFGFRALFMLIDRLNQIKSINLSIISIN